MKYAVEMGPGAMIYSYIPSFIKTGSATLKLMGGGNTQRAYFLFFQNEESYFFNLLSESRLKMQLPSFIPT
jgi:hypothetical protein